MNKEEIEQAKEDLMFSNEGDYITRSMSHSKDILQEYIKQLEKEKKEAYQKGYATRDRQAREICKTCNYRKRYKELTKKEEILDKVTDLATRIATENAEKYNSENQKEVDFSEWALASEILDIIEGEKK